MAGHSIQRRNRRIDYKTPITLEDKRTGYHYPGTLQNYSNSGLYFKSAYAQQPGRKIRIKNKNLPFNGHSGDYLAEVVWRKFVGQDHATHSFGVGAKFC